MNTIDTCYLYIMETETSSSVRKMRCEVGVVTRADGSARMQQGSTAVVCGVYGPVEVRAARERCDRAVLEVVVRGETGLPTGRERQLEQLLAGCCAECIRVELHPHTAISVTVQVESNDGSLISCMAHACCLALMDAGLPMKGLFTALTCSIAQDGSIVTDPTSDQQEEGCAVLSFVTNREGDLLSSHTVGSFTSQQLLQGLAAAKEVSTATVEFYRTAMSRKMSRASNKPVVHTQ